MAHTTASRNTPSARNAPASKAEEPSRRTLMQLIEQEIRRLSLPRLKRLAADLEITRPDGTLAVGRIKATTPTKSERRAAAGRSRSSASRRQVQLLSGAGIGPLVTLEEGRARLDSVTVEDPSTDWASSELLGAGDMAARLNVARTTLDNWRNAGKAIGFRKGVRNYVYPARQFDRLAPVPGIERVLPHFATPEDAWEWLVTPNQLTAGEAPIDRLRAKHVDEVERAAEGALDFV